MLTTSEIAIHWPFIRSHLLLERRPAHSRVLETLAELQSWNGGESVALRAKLLAGGATRGEAGNAWRALTELEAAGVTRRYRGSGRRPDLWTLTRALECWRVPWRWSAREVATVVGSCSCRAAFGFVARFPGQDDLLSRGGVTFDLPASAHLGKRSESRATNSEGRATTQATPRENDTPPRDNHRATTSPYTSPLEDVGRLRRPDDDDGENFKLFRLQSAIARATDGGRVYGAPLDRLRALADECNEELLEELAVTLELRKGTKAPPVLVDLAVTLVPVLRGEIHRRRRAEVDRLDFLEAHGAGEEPEAVALRERLGSLVADAG